MDYFPIIKEILHERFGKREQDITPETRLLEDLGCDSLDRVEITLEVEDQFDIEVEDADAERCVTVADMLALLDKTLAEQKKAPTGEDAKS